MSRYGRSWNEKFLSGLVAAPSRFVIFIFTMETIEDRLVRNKRVRSEL